ncbi:hypothetical protein EJB05_06581, partial [Eragrostis curvula]
ASGCQYYQWDDEIDAAIVQSGQPAMMQVPAAPQAPAMMQVPAAPQAPAIMQVPAARQEHGSSRVEDAAGLNLQVIMPKIHLVEKLTRAFKRRLTSHLPRSLPACGRRSNSPLPPKVLFLDGGRAVLFLNQEQWRFLTCCGGSDLTPDLQIVPCNVRAAFNTAVGDNFEMVTEQSLRYTLLVTKSSAKTFLEGEWSDFVEQHALQYGDKNNKILCGCSFNIRMSEITDDERKRLLSRLKSGKRITMKPLVHRLTATHVDNCSNLPCKQRLKKSVAEELNLQKSGTIQFRVPKEPCCHDVSYKIMTDGRASCQWKDVVKVHRLAVGQLLVLAPTLEEDNHVVLLYEV